MTSANIEVVYHFFHGGWLANESAATASAGEDEFEVFYNRPLAVSADRSLA